MSDQENLADRDNQIQIVEVGPRDGLQNEPRQIATADKVKLVDMLSDCGFTRIEVTSFVSPRWVPQMADGAQVLAQIARKPGVIYTALTPNLIGLQGAQEAGLREVAIFGAASQTFSQKNINCTIEESLQRFVPLIKTALEKGVAVRAYISCVTDCPYEGAVDPQAVARLAEKLFELGCYQIVMGETIGAGTPETILAMLDAVKQHVPVQALAGHYHDTNGRALDNIAASVEAGLRCFDAAVGGLGGCPYAPGAKGNVASEAVAAFAHHRGFDTGLDETKLAAAARFAKSLREETQA